MAENGKISTRQEQAIRALLTEPSIEKAALASRVGSRTLHRWLREPAFSDAYRQARADSVAQAIARLQQSSSEAVDALASILRDTEAPAAVKVTAASRILDLSLRATELEELKRRVEVLEHSDPPPDGGQEEAPIVA